MTPAQTGSIANHAATPERHQASSSPSFLTVPAGVADPPRVRGHRPDERLWVVEHDVVASV